MGRFIAQAKKQTIDTPIDVVLLSAGQGRRMKSFGSKSLFNVGGRTLIEHQIDIIKGPGHQKIKCKSIYCMPRSYLRLWRR